jgi:tRNA threonylcarbamoyladenosine biosynthesis protein TsaE
VSEIKFEEILKAGTNSIEEFQKACLEFSHYFTAKSVVALIGPLGAGKTELVRTISHSRGFQGMASPTFAIHHRYQGFSISIDHLDLYRLQSEDELDGVGFWDFFTENEGLIFIEWPERMNLSHIPWNWDLFLIEIDKPNETHRRLRLAKRRQTTS